MRQHSADDDDNSQDELLSQVSSATAAAHELEQEMPLIGEALELIHNMLDDIVRHVAPDRADEFAEDLERLSTLANMIRLHMFHI